MEKFLFTLIWISSASGANNIGFYLDEKTKPEVESLLEIFTSNNRDIANFIVETIQDDDSFKSNKAFCNMLEKNSLVAVVASESTAASPMIQSITSKLNIPYIQTNWLISSSYLSRENSLNFYPNFNLLSLGLSKIVESLQWKNFVLLYEDYDSFFRTQQVLNLQNLNENQKNIITIKKLDFNDDIRSTLKEIKQSGKRRIIITCRSEKILQVLEQAKQVGIMTFAHTYFIASLDSHIYDLQKFNSETNITTVRIINPEDENVKKIAEFTSNGNPFLVKTESLLLYESLNLLLQSIFVLQKTQSLTSDNISCHNKNTYNSGSEIIDYMKSNYKKSLDSPSSMFDFGGKRIDFSLYLIEGNREKVIATWDSVKPEVVNFFRTAEESYQKRVETLQTRIQNISSKIEPPYLMLKNDYKDRSGNDRFEGYIVDLITKISEKLNFQFNIVLVQSNTNGFYNRFTQSWNGIIGEIINEKAQFGISDMTITPSRESAVDFSMPFMRLGIGILLQKPKTTVSMFAFLNPLSAEVWMYTVTLYLAISIILYLVARMAPGDWENPHPCNLNPDQLENLWGIRNCLWLTMGSIMNQGSDILPKGVSSRLVTSMWWFFALIMTNSYIASLAAFLTAKGEIIDDLEDLAKQNKIKYGTLEGGSTQEFFRQSNYSTYRRMYANMILNLPSVFAKTTKEGVQRVQNTPDGSYAFLMESTTIDYLVERNCNLTTVDKWFNNIEYGIAMPLESPYRTAINDAILALQENGELNDLKNKWWREERSRCVTPQEGSELRLENVGGIFVVLGLGVGIALLLGIFEFLWTVRQTSVDEHISYWQAFKAELLFALKVWISKKNIKQDESGNSEKINGERWSQWECEQTHD